MYKVFPRLFFTLGVLFLFALSPVHAQETPQEKAPAQQERQEEPPAAEEEGQDQEALAEQRAAAKQAYDKVSAIVESLAEREQKHFMMIYSNYNLIQTVKTVRDDVAAAVEACGEENPDMEEELKARFEDWKGAVEPMIDRASANLNNMVLAQDYLPGGEMKTVFKAIDEAREKTAARLEKVPVTTKEACEYLLSKMDDTQENMIQLLERTLVSFSQAFPDSEADEEEAEEEKAGEEPSSAEDTESQDEAEE